MITLRRMITSIVPTKLRELDTQEDLGPERLGLEGRGEVEPMYHHNMISSEISDIKVFFSKISNNVGNCVCTTSTPPHSWGHTFLTIWREQDYQHNPDTSRSIPSHLHARTRTRTHAHRQADSQTSQTQAPACTVTSWVPLQYSMNTVYCRGIEYSPPPPPPPPE